MKLTKKVLAIALAGVLSLGAFVACDSEANETTNSKVSVTEIVEGTTNKDVKSAFNNDIMGQGVTLGENELIATINDVKINESIYRAYLWSAQSAFEMQLGMDMGMMKDMELEGQTIGDIAKDNALKSVALAIITNNKANEMGIKLTDEQLNTIETDASTFMDINGEIAQLHGFNKQDVIDLLIGAELSNEVQKAISETYMPDETEIETEIELAKPSYETVTARHILITTMDDQGAPLSEETKAEKLELANSLLDRIKAGEDIGVLAAEYSQDPGSSNNNGEYTFGRGEMVPEFEAAAFDNEDGAIWAEPVETSYGYHIGQTIAHQEADEEQIKKDYIAYAQMNFAGEEIMSFVDQANIETTTAYDDIEIISSIPEPAFELMPEENVVGESEEITEVAEVENNEVINE
ncbi:hypothetical protein AN641_05995 [Candidatus Epulonipiscioides gigas]|nr:hypothetical protein AN641_05995 [Epulopiscium sp. SCG-C07WGA-EpuloA2]